jgi:hypothetical protein
VIALNRTEIEEATRKLFEKIFPDCDVERPKIQKHGQNYYEIEAEMEPHAGCRSGFNPSGRYNLRLKIKAELIETPLGKLKP